ncbi:MAG: cation:proton antiporter subunit C [Pseudomonadota bacterium]
MVEFILGRANYWAIIALMMVGLYITYQSTNLIKRLVGLSVFQTSVFLFYITLGKVAGGTAPILYGKDAYGHGGGHGAEHQSDHEAEGTSATSHDLDARAPDNSVFAEDQSVTEGIVQLADETVQGVAALEAPDIAHSAEPDVALAGAEQLELTGLQEVYSNPLPHVLILTAIVVGVATLSVGLAIVVRIRESYGTIESDEVREKDIAIADAQDADDPVVAGGA